MNAAKTKILIVHVTKKSNMPTKMKRSPIKKDLTVEQLKAKLFYDPETGLFTRKVSGHGKMAGEVAGTKTGNGYIHIMVNGRHYLAHRLAWLYVFGDWPPNYIDHINGINDDNRIANLRLATAVENGMNRRVKKTSKSQIKGVYWCCQTGKWKVDVTVKGKTHGFGRYSDINEAAEVAARETKRLHGEFARVE